MKLGICYPYELEPRAAFDLIRACDERGMDSVWIVENPGWPGAFATAGAVTAITHRMLVSIGVVSAFTRSPAAIAAEAGQLQKLSAGRCRLGIGVGSSRVLGNLGIDTRHPVAGIAETVDVLRPLLAEGIKEHQGPRYTVRDFKLAFEFEPPTIHIGTMGPRMTALAGRVADGVIISTHAPDSLTQQMVATVRAAAQSAGRSPADVHMTAFVIACFRNSAGEARDALRPRLAVDVARIARNVPSSAEMFAAAGLDAKTIRALTNADRPEDVAHLIDDAVVDALCLAGDGATFQRRLAELRAMGIDEIVLFQAAEEPGFAEHLDELVAAANGAAD